MRFKSRRGMILDRLYQKQSLTIAVRFSPAMDIPVVAQ